MKATWQNNSVEFVQWKGNNIEDVKSFVKEDRTVFLATDGSMELYIVGTGRVRTGDYICKNGNYAFNSLQIYSYKVFPRIINEDINSFFSEND